MSVYPKPQRRVWTYLAPENGAWVLHVCPFLPAECDDQHRVREYRLVPVVKRKKRKVRK